MRLRQQSGVAALAALASDVPDPFLKSGLCLVAAGLPAQDLERALDSALARQAEAYLDQLAQMRTRLLALARG
jgi:flagellar motor component MotA